MTAPVFVIDDLGSAETGSVVLLGGTEGRHAIASQRLGTGEAVDLVDGRGRRAAGIIETVETDRTAKVRIVEVHDEPPHAPRVTVVQALAKGERGELAVELLTEIGVDAIVPWSARHCVTQWKGERAERGHRKWVDAAQAAAKQSRRAHFPDVTPVRTTADITSLIRSADLALLLHEKATVAIGSVDLPLRGDVVIIVGPEGGVAPDEVEQFEAAGARPVLVGPTVLRTSSAGIAAVAVLLSRSPRWDARMRP